MLEQISVARDSLNTERQQQQRGGAVARAGIESAGPRGGRALETVLAGELGGEAVDAPNQVRLRVEKDIDRVVAEVVDRDSGEVVREIPPEDMVAAAKKLEAMLGRVLDREA